MTAAQSTADSLASIAENFAGKQSGIYKAMFIASKAFAIADAIIKIQSGIASALSLPFPANLPAIAQVAALGASIISNITAVAAQFDTGGWTGDVGRNQIAGAVHGQEFVVRAGPAAKHRAILESMNSGRDPTAGIQEAARSSGGGALMQPMQAGPMNVQLQNYAPNVVHEVQRGLTRDEVVIIAREQAPRAVAGDLAKPNSATRKALQIHTTARGRKT